MRFRFADFFEQSGFALGQILPVNFCFSPALAVLAQTQVPRITAHVDGDGQRADDAVRIVAGGELGHGELLGDEPFRHKTGPRARVWISLAQSPLFFQPCDRRSVGRGFDCFPRWIPKGEEPFGARPRRPICARPAGGGVHRIYLRVVCDQGVDVQLPRRACKF